MTALLKRFTVPFTTKLDFHLGIPTGWTNRFIAVVKVASRFVIVGANQMNLAKLGVFRENLKILGS